MHQLDGSANRAIHSKVQIGDKRVLCDKVIWYEKKNNNLEYELHLGQ